MTWNIDHTNSTRTWYACTFMYILSTYCWGTCVYSLLTYIVTLQFYACMENRTFSCQSRHLKQLMWFSFTYFACLHFPSWIGFQRSWLTSLFAYAHYDNSDYQLNPGAQLQHCMLTLHCYGNTVTIAASTVFICEPIWGVVFIIINSSRAM